MTGIPTAGLQVTHHIRQQCVGTWEETSDEVQQAPATRTALSAFTQYKSVFTHFTDLHQPPPTHSSYTHTCTHSHIHSLYWIVGGLFDDLAVDLISKELLLFSKLQGHISHSVEKH